MSTNEVTADSSNHMTVSIGGVRIPATRVTYEDGIGPAPLTRTPGVYESIEGGAVTRRRTRSRIFTSARAITLDVPPALALRA